jgi:hypothetical protein
METKWYYPHSPDAKSCVATKYMLFSKVRNTPRTHYGCAIIAPPLSREESNAIQYVILYFDHYNVKYYAVFFLLFIPDLFRNL